MICSPSIPQNREEFQYFSNHQTSSLLRFILLSQPSYFRMSLPKSVLNFTKPSAPSRNRSKKFQEEVGIQPPKKDYPNKGILGTGKTGDKLKFAMWNVNGIRSVLNKNNLTRFVSRYEPDIFCVNQTKINKEQYDKSPILIHGYNGYWNFCKCSAGYSGVAIFSKFLPISISQDLEETSHSQEGRVITLEFEKFYVVAVYIPSAGGRQLERLAYKTQQYEVAFHKYCQQLKTKGKIVIVGGDMNVAVEDLDIHVTPNIRKQPGSTDEERKSFKGFLNKGWVDTYRKMNPTTRVYTWWRVEHANRERNIGKRLDYFLINQDSYCIVTKADVLGEYKGSDHCPISLEVDFSKAKDAKSLNQLEKGLQTKSSQQSEKKENSEQQNVEPEKCQNPEKKEQISTEVAENSKEQAKD